MSRLCGLVVAVPTCTVAGQVRGPAELANATVPAAARRVAYGGAPLSSSANCACRRTKGPFPVANVIHGGCWVAKLGNFDERAVAMDNMRPLAAALTARDPLLREFELSRRAR